MLFVNLPSVSMAALTSFVILSVSETASAINLPPRDTCSQWTCHLALNVKSTDCFYPPQADVAPAYTRAIASVTSPNSGFAPANFLPKDTCGGSTVLLYRARDQLMKADFIVTLASRTGPKDLVYFTDCKKGKQVKCK